MNADLILKSTSGSESTRDINLTTSTDISMEELQALTLPFTRDDITTIEFNGSEVTLNLSEGELVVSDFMDQFGNIKEIYTVNGQLLFKDVGDLIGQLGAPAAGNVAAEGSSSVFNFVDELNPFLDSGALGYRDLRAGLKNPNISITDLNGDSDNPFVVVVPEALPDTLIFDEGAFGEEQGLPSGNVLANDSGVQGAILTVIEVNGQPLVDGTIIITLLSGATVQVNEDGSYQVLNPEIYEGLGLGVDEEATDTFIYTVSDGEQTDSSTVTITVNGVNDLPSVASTSISVAEESTDTSLGLTAPTDVDGDELTITVTGLPSVGTVTLANGDAVSVDDILTAAQLEGLQYDAPTDYDDTTEVGEFTYSVFDGTATVSGSVDIGVTEVNDAPLADDKALDTAEDTAVSVVLSGSDVDGTVTHFNVATLPTDGTLYTTYIGSEDPGNVAYVAGADIAATNGEATLVFVPAEDFNSETPVSINYTATDDDAQASASATVSVTVTDVNDAPLADDKALETAEDTAVNVVLSGSDVDGTVTHFNVATLPTDGTLYTTYVGPEDPGNVAYVA
ncbi:MAG: VCBS domain-containing protein, partial [Amphritea sp.]|nr:VCBS domain-containing protein [Amphritea sp.]